MMASSFSSSSSTFFSIEPLDGGGESETCRHAMDACSLCGKRFAGDSDIFMYRGDTPFCSEECRYHQMVRDDFATRENLRRSVRRGKRRSDDNAAGTRLLPPPPSRPVSRSRQTWPLRSCDQLAQSGVRSISFSKGRNQQFDRDE